MLENLYEELISSSSVSYFPKYQWPIETDDGTCPDPLKYPELKLTHTECEALLIEKQAIPREFVIVGAFSNEQRLSIRWCGEDALSMKRTGKALCIPTSSGNLGERAFRILVGHLELKAPIEPSEVAQMCSSELAVIRKIQKEEGIIESGICLTQDIAAGKQDQLRLILAKLVRVYEGGAIDENFYHECKSRRTNRST